MTIRPINQADYTDIARIYSEGLETGIASFETKVPDWEGWNSKFLDPCRLLVSIENEIGAWCALSAVSNRQVYKGVAEVTIYVANKWRGQGIGKKLLTSLIKASEDAGFWTLQAGIFPENKASLALHKACGFRVIGIRERPAKRLGKWYDNVLLERRSTQL